MDLAYLRGDLLPQIAAGNDHGSDVFEIPSPSSIRSLARAAMKAQSTNNLGSVTAVLEQLKQAAHNGDNPLQHLSLQLSHAQPQNQEPELSKKCYCTDEFRMYRFKIEVCPNLDALHDWTDCPFLHPGEKARRRDPRITTYQPLPCPDFRKGQCKRGDSCQWAHGVFECWLHPSRYRTQLCKEGAACPRSVCFFAHSVSELREATTTSDVSPPRTCTQQSDENSLSLDAITKKLASISTGTTTTTTGTKTQHHHHHHHQGQLPSVKSIQDLLYASTTPPFGDHYNNKSSCSSSAPTTTAPNSYQSVSQETSRTSSPLSQSYDNIAALNAAGTGTGTGTGTAANMMPRSISAYVPGRHHHHTTTTTTTNMVLPHLSRTLSHSLNNNTNNHSRSATPLSSSLSSASSSFSSMHHLPQFSSGSTTTTTNDDDWSAAAAAAAALQASRLQSSSCPLPLPMGSSSSTFGGGGVPLSLLQQMDSQHHYHQQQMIDPGLAAMLLSQGTW